MRVHTFVFNWPGHFEAALQLENVAREFSHKVTVINSDPHHTAGGWVDLGNEAYFGEQFATACEMFDGDVLFHIQADAGHNNWSSLVSTALETFAAYDCGIYAPQIDRHSHIGNELPAASATLSPPSEHLRVVSNTDCTAWFIHSSVMRHLVEYAPLMRLNRFGLGIDVLAAALAFSQKRLVLRDDRYVINHPSGTGYSLEEAAVQLRKFISHLPPEIRRRVIKLAEHARASTNYSKPKTFPKYSQIAKNLAKSAAAETKAIVSGVSALPVDEQKRRFKLCQVCDRFASDQGRCTACGCFMGAKTKLRSATCPLGKW